MKTLTSRQLDPHLYMKHMGIMNISTKYQMPGSVDETSGGSLAYRRFTGSLGEPAVTQT